MIISINKLLKCAWCRKEYKEATYPNVQSFTLSYNKGTTSDIFGSSLVGYEVKNMCNDCAVRFRETLIDLDIEVVEVDI